MPSLQPHDVGFGDLFWHVPDAVVVGDAGTGLIALWNPAAERIFGYTASEAVGLTIEALIPASLRPNHRAGLEAYRTTGHGALIDGHIPVEVPALHRSGSEIWIELSLSPVLHAGVAGTYVLAIIRDVTARRRAEEEVRSLNEDLERRVRERTAELEAINAERAAILQQMADGLMLVTRGGRLAFMNVEARRLFGIDGGADGAELRASLERVLVPEEGDEPWPDSSLGRAILEGRAVEDAEQLIRRADGSVAHLAVKATPVVGTHGDRLGAVATFRDVTKRHELDRQKATFLSAAAHDLKTPLTTIKGVGQLLQRRLMRLENPEAARIGEELTRIDATVNRMTNMVNEFLEVSGAHMGQGLTLNREPADLLEAIERVVSDVAPDRSRVTVTSSARSVQGMWDVERIERALGNIVANATKYSAAASPVAVTVRYPAASGDRQAVEIAVCDRGIGIPAADLPHVLEPFYRAQNVDRRVPGTGVGLAGAKQIVERHGGSLSIDSREGHGTTVTVHLPVITS